MADENKRRSYTLYFKTEGDADIKKASKALESINKSIKETSATVNGLKNIAATFIGGSIFGFGVRELAGIADGMTLVSGRITALTGDATKTKAIMEELSRVAQDTKASLTDISNVFGRVAVATQNLGISTESQIGLTKILQQSFRLSGSTAEEATASTLQFTQALSFGQLRGQELRSVLSQNATVANLFSKAIAGSGKDIYKFAEAGGFTTKFVLKILGDNFDAINTKANGMSQTFEQTLTLAMNKFRQAVANINEEFNINGRFAKFVDFMLQNLPTLGAVIVSLSAFAIPALIGAINSLNAALLVNPFYAILAGLVFTLIKVSGGFSQAGAEILTFIPALTILALEAGKATIAVASLGASLVFKDPLTKSLDSQIESLRSFIEKTRKEAQTISIPVAEPKTVDYGKAISGAALKIKEPIKSLELQIGALNSAFNRGAVTDIPAFNEKLRSLEIRQLKEEMNKGSVTLEQYKEKLSKIDLAGFARLLDGGIISIEEFNKKVTQFKIEELEQKFLKGKIQVGQFYQELVKLKQSGFLDSETYSNGIGAGVASYLESLGTLSSQISDIVKSSFQAMEEAIFKATKSGKFEFGDFAQSVLDDLTRIAIRMAIIRPIAGALGSLFSPGDSGGGFVPQSGPGLQAEPFAKGGAFSGGTQFFASGGIVSSATSFGMSGGKTGVMGEAGPEAIIPLRRSSDGSLGVAGAGVSINIINNNGSEVVSKESTDGGGSKTIDIIIQAKVKEGFGNGSFDRAMQQNYGLQRKGL